MTNKPTLQNIISKYYLNGTVEAVKWDVKDKDLNVRFTSPDRELIGEINSSNFDLSNASIGINNTSQLLKLINIVGTEVLMTHTVNKLTIADNQFTISYTLANILTIPKVGTYAGPNEYNIEIDLTPEIINALIKAKTALPESKVLILSPFTNPDNDFELAITFGGDLEHANKVSYYIPKCVCKNLPHNFLLGFNSDLFKEVLTVNKDSVKSKLCINTDGVINLEFDNNIVKSKYYIVNKDL